MVILDVRHRGFTMNRAILRLTLTVLVASSGLAATRPQQNSTKTDSDRLKELVAAVEALQQKIDDQRESDRKKEKALEEAIEEYARLRQFVQEELAEWRKRQGHRESRLRGLVHRRLILEAQRRELVGLDKAHLFSQDEKVDICEAVFRYQFAHNASGQQQKAAAYFLQVRNQDLGPALFDRFGSHIPPVRKGSEFSTGSGLKFYIKKIYQLGKHSAIVSGGYSEGPLSASGNTYKLSRTHGQWQVDEDVRHWIS
jgi:hypothetical protein